MHWCWVDDDLLTTMGTGRARMKTPMRAHSPPINWTFNNDEADHGGGGADDGLYEADDGDQCDEDDIQMPWNWWGNFASHSLESSLNLSHGKKSNIHCEEKLILGQEAGFISQAGEETGLVAPFPRRETELLRAWKVLINVKTCFATHQPTNQTSTLLSSLALHKYTRWQSLNSLSSRMTIKQFFGDGGGA